MRSTAAVLAILLAGCVSEPFESGDAPLDGPAVKPLYLADGDFERPELVDAELGMFDTGTIHDACIAEAPWGDTSWGLNSATFLRSDERHQLEQARFRIVEDEGSRRAGLSALSHGFRMGFARFIQGDTWGGTHCGPIGWRRPEPEPTHGRRLALQVDVKRESTDLFSNRLLISGRSHLMMAFNVWLTSPALPRRAVLDLAVFHKCNYGLGRCGPGDDPIYHDDDYAFRRIARIGRDTPRNQWTRWTIDLSNHLDDLANHYGWSEEVRSSLAINQVEFLIEVMDASGSMLFDNVRLVEVPEGLAFQEGSMRLPLASPTDDPLAAAPVADPGGSVPTDEVPAAWPDEVPPDEMPPDEPPPDELPEEPAY